MQDKAIIDLIIGSSKKESAAPARPQAAGPPVGQARWMR
jgi:hypothetical protein